MSHEDTRLLDDATGLVQLTNEAATDFVVEDGAGTVSHGDWTQAATWSATGAQAYDANATWVQTASWDATGDVTAAVTGTASWVQTQTWDASGSAAGVAPELPRGAARIIGPAQPRVERRTARASWVQEPATWHAEMTYIENDDWLVLDDLLLAGAA